MNGFPCPSHQSPSDHYLRTINTDFDEVRFSSSSLSLSSDQISNLQLEGPGQKQNFRVNDDQDIDQRFGGEMSSTKEVIKTLVRSYKSTNSYRQVRRQMSDINRLVSKTVPVQMR